MHEPLEDAVRAAFGAAASRALPPARARAAIDAAFGAGSLSTVAALYGVSRETVRRSLGLAITALDGHPGALRTHPALANVRKLGTDFDADADAMLSDGLGANRVELVSALRILAKTSIVTSQRRPSLVQLVGPGAPIPLWRIDDICDPAEVTDALAKGSVWTVMTPGHRHMAKRLNAPEKSPVLRQLRRMLTLTGPLNAANILGGWQRMNNRTGFVPLPAYAAVLLDWAMGTDGLDAERGQIRAVPPVDLDDASRAFQMLLTGVDGGRTRGDLLEAAPLVGIQPATLAAALSWHPAVTQISRGTWGLRGTPQAPDQPRTVENSPLGGPRRRHAASSVRAAVSYTWATDGRLVLEATHTGVPSPTLPIPAAIAALIVGREYRVRSPLAPGKVAVLKARNRTGWGLTGLLNELRVGHGDRYSVLLDLVTANGELRTQPIEPA